MNNMELETDIEAIDMEMGDVTIHYCPVIPNPEGEPTAELKTADIEGTIYEIVDEEARNTLENKVDKEEGKGLSSNDYSDEDKAKLDSVENGAEVNVQSDWDENDNSKDDFIKNKPTKLSDFDNDEGFIDKTVDNLDNYYKKDETYTQSEVNSALSGKVDNSTLDNYYTKTETDTALGNKVDKVQGKGLSENDFTDTLKDKLDGIEAEANKTVVDNSVTSTSTNPVESKAIYNLLNDLLPEATETGNPISITNASGLNAKSLKVELEPIQDLNGYDSPWVGGGGKNKIDVSNGTGVKARGVTPSYDNNGGLNFVGTPTEGGYIGNWTLSNAATLPAGTYTFSISENAFRRIVFLNNWTTVSSIQSGTNSNTVTFSQEVTINRITMEALSQDVNVPMSINIGKIQIESGNQATSYAPYSNICPISGRTQTVVKQMGKNIVDYSDVVIDSANGGFAFNTDYDGISADYSISFDYARTESGQLTFRTFKNSVVVAEVIQNFNSSSGRISFSFSSSEFDEWRCYVNKKGTISNIQIEYGLSATTYEPYISIPDTTIPFNQTVYGGEVDVTSGGTKPLIRKVFNGNPTNIATVGDYTRILISLSTDEKAKYPNGFQISDCLPLVVSFSDQSEHFYLNENQIVIFFLSSRCGTTSQSVNTYLSSNPLTVCYEAKEPTTISTPSNEISLLKGANTLVADGDMELVYSKTPQ